VVIVRQWRDEQHAVCKLHFNRLVFVTGQVRDMLIVLVLLGKIPRLSENRRHLEHGHT